MECELCGCNGRIRASRSRIEAEWLAGWLRAGLGAPGGGCECAGRTRWCAGSVTTFKEGTNVLWLCAMCVLMCYVLCANKCATQ